MELREIVARWMFESCDSGAWKRAINYKHIGVTTTVDSLLVLLAANGCVKLDENQNYPELPEGSVTDTPADRSNQYYWRRTGQQDMIHAGFRRVLTLVEVKS